MVCGKTFASTLNTYIYIYTGRKEGKRRGYNIYKKTKGSEVIYILYTIYIEGKDWRHEGCGGDNNYRLPTNEVR